MATALTAWWVRVGVRFGTRVRVAVRVWVWVRVRVRVKVRVGVKVRVKVRVGVRVRVRDFACYKNKTFRGAMFATTPQAPSYSGMFLLVAGLQAKGNLR